MPGYVSKALTKHVTASSIKWTVKVNFDNGDVHSLSFHPLEKRWRVFQSNKKPVAAATTAEETTSNKKKAAAAKKSVTKKTTAVGEKKKDGKVKADKKKKKAGEKDKKVVKAKKSTAKSTNSATSKSKGGKQMKQSTLSFGSQLQSKIKEVSSKMHTAKKADAAAGSDESEKKSITTATVGGGLVRYSPNTIIAIKAAHAKSQSNSPEAAQPPVSIGYCETLPPGTLSPDKKNGRKVPIALEKAYRKRAPTQLSLIGHTSPQLNNAKQAAKTALLQSQQGSNKDNHANSTKSDNEQTMKNLYKKECNKAKEFVAQMKTEEKSNSSSSSPESQGDGDLELKLDQERMKLFNSILSEIMFNRQLDMMDVEEMIEKMNAHQSSSKPFTLLEIKPFLHKLHDASRIFMVEDEGNMGVVYSV